MGEVKRLDWTSCGGYGCSPPFESEDGHLVRASDVYLAPRAEVERLVEAAKRVTRGAIGTDEMVELRAALSTLEAKR